MHLLPQSLSSSHDSPEFQTNLLHTTYSRNNMGQKCEGNCGLSILNEIMKNIYPENLKKILGAVLKLPAK